MHKPRKLALAVLASITIAGIAGASASSLGNLNSQSVGSDDDIVASCDTDGIDVAYTTGFDATTAQAMISGVTLSGVNSACDGQDATLRLTDGTATLGTATAVLSVDANGVALMTLQSPANAKATKAVSLVIQG